MNIWRRFQGWLWQQKERFYHWRNPTVVIHEGPLSIVNGDYDNDSHSPVYWPDSYK